MYHRSSQQQSRPRPQEHHQAHNQSSPPTSLLLHSIHRGTVRQIAPYGAFVKLPQPYGNYSGLVHISQLCNARVEKVEDVVSAGDSVFVKVLEVEEQEAQRQHINIRQGSSADDRSRSRVKLKLSMKYVDQNDGHDLDPNNEQQNSRNDSSSSRPQASSLNVAGSMLADSLNSRIGMSTAMDPMAGSNGKSRNLVIKGGRGHNTASTATRMFNGYALVDEDEPAPEKSEPTSIPFTNAANYSNPMSSRGPSSHVNAEVMTSSLSDRPTGRGRGSTLPAWMTNKDLRDKVSDQMKRHDYDDSHSTVSSDNDSLNYSRRKKKHRKHQKKKHSSSRKERKHSHKKSSKKSRKRSNRKSSGRKRSRYTDDESARSYSSGTSSESDCRFSNVEEAKALIARLEGETSKRIKR